MKNNILQIVSYNCQGLNSVEKLRDVFDYLKSKNCNIYSLQDTHFTKNDETAIINQWGGKCIFNALISNQRGVAILLSNNFEYKISNTKKDDCGNLLGVDIEIEGKTITLINIYGPNNDTPLFYNKVSESIEYFNNHSTILTGDYSLVQDQIWDIYTYVGINNPKAKDKVLDRIEIYNLTDPLKWVRKISMFDMTKLQM